MGARAWLIAAVAAGLSVVFCVAAVQRGRGDLAAPGLFAAMLLFWTGQQQFAERHRERYARWPAGLGMFWTGSPERYEVLRAYREKADDRTVELSRWLAFALVGLAILGAAVFLVALNA